MHVCPNCGHRSRPGVIFCENCGASLIGDSPISTRSVAAKPSGGESGDPISTVIANASTDVFSKGTILRVEITGAEPVLLKPKAETVFGRRDPATGAMPDLDLTPFAGYRMGVSRRHVLIKQNEAEHKLELVDLGSSNGTFLNGTRTQSDHSYTLHDGDEIRLGQLSMKIYFEAPIQPVEQNGVQQTTTPTASEPPQPPEQKSAARSTIETNSVQPASPSGTTENKSEADKS